MKSYAGRMFKMRSGNVYTILCEPFVPWSPPWKTTYPRVVVIWEDGTVSRMLADDVGTGLDVEIFQG